MMLAHGSRLNVYECQWASRITLERPPFNDLIMSGLATGITTYSYMEALIGKGTHETTPETAALIKDGMFYFRRIIDLYGTQPGNQVLSYPSSERLESFVR